MDEKLHQQQSAASKEGAAAAEAKALADRVAAEKAAAEKAGAGSKLVAPAPPTSTQPVVVQGVPLAAAGPQEELKEFRLVRGKHVGLQIGETKLLNKAQAKGFRDLFEPVDGVGFEPLPKVGEKLGVDPELLDPGKGSLPAPPQKK